MKLLKEGVFVEFLILITAIIYKMTDITLSIAGNM